MSLDGLTATPDSVAHLGCAGCKKPLALRVGDDGKPLCTLDDPNAAAAKASPPAPAPAPKSKSKSKKAPKSAKAPRSSKAKGRGKAMDAPQPKDTPKTKDAPSDNVKAEPDPAPETPAGAEAETSGDSLVGEFSKGDLIGRYTIEKAVGVGGTSTVYSAFDPTTNRSVALKVLMQDASDVMRTRFLREIEVQANIRHQNIMPVFDRGELDDGRPFFTMEKLYKPWTLADIIEKRDAGKLARYATLKKLEDIENLIRDVIVPVADGVYVANVENGVIHRDLKPENILIDSRTLRPYVIDFGICQVLEKKSGFASKAVIPPTGEEEGIVGTPRFLAPEQVKGNVHARTDVWGLGATIFAAVASDPPIAAARNINKVELKRRIEALQVTKKKAVAADDERKIAMCEEQLARLTDPNLRTLDDLFRDARDGVYTELPQTTPAPLRAVVRKAMAVGTSDRYVNARQLATELQAWLGGSRVRALTEAGGTEAAVESARRAVRTHLVTALWLAGGLVAGIFLAKLTATAGDAPPSTRVADAEADIQQLADSLDGLERLTVNLTPIERNRLWTSLDTTAGRIQQRLEGEDASDARVDAVSKRLAFVRGRFAPTRFRIDAPAGTRLEAKDLVNGGKVAVQIGENRLPPGSYHVFTSTNIRFPVDVGLLIRDTQGAADVAHEPPVQILKIGVAPDAVPAGMVLVLGGRVLARDLPFQPRSPAATEVAAFFMSRAEVTNGAYAQFLATLDVEARKAHAPNVAFIPDPEQGGVPIVTKGREEAPVVGLRVEDALAYAAWRSKTTGAVVRLPTEAEWVLAAGAPLGYDLTNGVAGQRTDGEFASPLRTAGAHVKDVSPFGVFGMLGNAREMVTSSLGDLGEGDVLVKGAGVGDDPDRGAIYLHRVLKKGERQAVTGFRLVQELPKP